MPTSLPRKCSKTAQKNRISRQKLLSPFGYEYLQNSEAKRVVNQARSFLNDRRRSSIDKKIAAQIVLSLISGISIERISKIKRHRSRNCPGPVLYWRKIDGVLCLAYHPGVPRDDLSGQTSYTASPMMVETTATEDLVYPVPPVLSEHLLIPSSANSCANVSAVLKCLTVDLNRPVNLSKISAFAKHHFRQNSRKPSHFLYLTGSIISEEVGLHYLQARTGDLLAPYIHFVQNLGLFVPKINLPDKLIGSAHVLKKQAVTVILSEFYADLRSVEIRSINGFFAHHNWFVSYVSIVLMFATASRGERRQPIRFKDFNFNDGLLILREKGGSRIVPLPHSVMKQLRYYRRYLEHIKKRSRARDRDLFERLEQVLNPDTNAPFLFTISNEGGFECAFSDDLFIQNIFGLKRNFARHFGYTQLVKKLIEEDLKAMLGHVREFDGSTDLFSCQSFQQLDAVRASIDHLLRDLNIKVFDPFSVSLKPRRKAA